MPFHFRPFLAIRHGQRCRLVRLFAFLYLIGRFSQGSLLSAPTEAFYPLRGTVVDATGRGISNAIIAISGSSGTYRLNTDKAGEFMTNLTAGRWWVAIDFNYLTSQHSVAIPQNTAVILDSRSGDASDVTFVLKQLNAVITGFLQKDNGEGLTNVSIGASGLDWPVSSGGITDGTGHFRFEVPAGSWRVQAGYSLIDIGLRTIPKTVSVVPGQTNVVTLIASAIPVTTHVRGRVVDEAGLPVSARVSWNGRNTGGFRTNSIVDGSFDLPTSGGSLSINVQPLAALATPLIAPTINISVMDGVEQNGINFTLRRPTKRITGTVRLASGEPVSDVEIGAVLTSGPGTFYISQATTNGQFALPVFSGRWTVFTSVYPLTRRLIPPS